MALLLAAAVAYSLALASIGFEHSLLGAHYFRQTYTALSAAELRIGGPANALNAPVFGPPWAIPLELPLFQALVALTSLLFATPLDQTGRAWSLFFFYATLVPGYLLLGELRLSRAQRFFVLSLFVTSPFYIAWARTFLIESLSLFLCVLYLASVSRALRGGRRAWPIVAMVAGAAAGMEKVTTFAPFALVALIWIGRRRPRDPMAWALAAVPLGATLGWSAFASHVRAQNALATLPSANNDARWYFGTVQQKFSMGTYTVILSRLFSELFGSLGWIAAALALLCGLFTKRRGAIAALFALFLLGIAVFTNVHVIHEYYQYENALFLIAAVGVSIVALASLRGAGLPIAILLAGVLFASQYAEYTRWFLFGIAKEPVVSNPSTWDPVLATAMAIKQRAPDRSVIVVYGFGNNPALAYYGERRAVMVAAEAREHREVVEGTLERLAPLRVGAVVVCGNDPADVAGARGTAARFGIEDVADYRNEQCAVYSTRAG